MPGINPGALHQTLWVLPLSLFKICNWLRRKGKAAAEVERKQLPAFWGPSAVSQYRPGGCQGGSCLPSHTMLSFDHTGLTWQRCEVGIGVGWVTSAWTLVISFLPFLNAQLQTLCGCEIIAAALYSVPCNQQIPAGVAYKDIENWK